MRAPWTRIIHDTQRLSNVKVAGPSGFPPPLAQASTWIPRGGSRSLAAQTERIAVAGEGGEARERWAALRAFYAAHGHLLVTNGPYILTKWSEGSAVLGVFRDFSYPLGVGSFDAYAIPRRAYIFRVEQHGGRLEVTAEMEELEKFQRSYDFVRAPFRPGASILNAVLRRLKVELMTLEKLSSS